MSILVLSLFLSSKMGSAKVLVKCSGLDQKMTISEFSSVHLSNLLPNAKWFSKKGSVSPLFCNTVLLHKFRTNKDFQILKAMGKPVTQQV